MAESINTTPKRKRGTEAGLAPWIFSFDPSPPSTQEDGSNSPRSVVARKFLGLALESGGGVGEDTDIDMDANDAMRKRHKSDEEMKDPLQPQTESEPTNSPVDTIEKPDLAPLLEVPSLSSEGSLQKSYPSINRLSESKSRKKRPGTPPLRMKKGQAPEGLSDADDEAEVVDPVRAALTWHEDEITIYDPEDEDDDGTGINGIGFKPTPALAHARVMKRRQQMADYRKREENDARARRSLRRRGEGGVPSRRDNRSPASRKVRFMDADHRNITLTTV